MYKIKIIPITKIKNNTEYTEPTVFITREIKFSNQSALQVPHPITEFVIKTSNSINAATAKANKIIQFFNFILQEIDDSNELFNSLKTRGLPALNWTHLAEYLNYCNDVLDNSYKTVIAKEHVLKTLYSYLFEIDLLEDIHLKITTDLKNNKIISTPFTEGKTLVNYPAKDKVTKTKLKNLEINEWRLFLEISQKFAPEITLGLYLQMMGGLRLGEVVNLNLNSIDLDSTTNIAKVDIKDRQKELFEDRFINNLLELQVRFQFLLYI